MNSLRSWLAILLLVAVAAHASTDKRNAEAARRAYKQALAAEQHSDFAGALSSLREAIDLAPGNTEYLAELAKLRQQVINQDLDRGNAAMTQNQIAEAVAQFGAALTLDPENSFTQQRLRDAQSRLPTAEHDPLDFAGNSREIELAPRPGTAVIHFNGDTRALLTEIATDFGLRATFDDNFPTHIVSLNLENIGFSQALNLAVRLADAMWVATSSEEIFFAQNTPDKHRQFDRMLERSFYLRDLSTAQQLNDVSSVLRSMFDIRYVVVDANQSVITVKAPQPMLDAATEFLRNLEASRPEVQLDIRAYEISANFLQQLGLTLPAQFQILNIPPQIVRQFQNSDIQNQIQQIQQAIANGTVTQAQLQTLQNLTNQIQSLQNSALGSLLNQPFITFGHGLTLFAVTYPGTLALNFSNNTSYVTTLEDATLRAGQGETATLLIGTRYPVLTSSFGLPTQTASNNVGLANFPTFNYEDIGISFKAKPQVHIFPPVDPVTARLTGRSTLEASEITLDVDFAIKALGAQTINTIPVITNREYKGIVRLRDGEPALVMGSITKDQERSYSGIPGLGRIPILSRLTGASNTNNSADEIMIVVTPHVVRVPGARVNSAVAIPAGQ